MPARRRGTSSIGRRVQVQMPAETEAVIVGVVGDVKLNGPGEATQATVYRPYEQVGPTLAAFEAFERAFVLRVADERIPLAEPVRRAVRRVDATALIDRYATLLAAISATLTTRRVTVILLSAFTAAALLLGAVGIYGLMAYSVRARWRELSIRVALGASRGRLLRQVLRDALKVAALAHV